MSAPPLVPNPSNKFEIPPQLQIPCTHSLTMSPDLTNPTFKTPLCPLLPPPIGTPPLVVEYESFHLLD